MRATAQLLLAGAGAALFSCSAPRRGLSEPPVPHRVSAATAATAPIAPNTRCPVNSISIIDANMKMAIIS